MNRGGHPRRDGRVSGDANFDAGVGEEDPWMLTADHGIYFSADGHRREEALLNISHKKRRLEPSLLDDRLAAWIPVPEDSLDVPAGLDEESQPVPSAGDKRKRYDSSVFIFPFFWDLRADADIPGRTDGPVETDEAILHGRIAVARWDRGPRRARLGLHAVCGSLHAWLLRGWPRAFV